MSAPRLGAWVEYRAEDGVPLTATRSEIGGEVAVSVWPRFGDHSGGAPRIALYVWIASRGDDTVKCGTVSVLEGAQRRACSTAYQIAKRSADEAAEAIGWTWRDQIRHRPAADDGTARSGAASSD